MTGEWVKWPIEYEKESYDVRLPSGEIIKFCWPNASQMHENSGQYRSWDWGADIEVRLSDPDDPDAPWNPRKRG